MFLSLLGHARPRAGELARGKKGDGASECRGYSIRNEPAQMKYVVVAFMVAAGPFVGRRKSCICRWLRGSGRGQERRRKVLRQGGQSNVQGAERWDGGLVHLFRMR